MIIIHISDTHNKHTCLNGLLPEGDVIVHSGDATGTGYFSEVTSFLKWFGSLPYKHRIFVAGNHDWLFEEDRLLAKELCKEHNVIWLDSESIEIDGIKFYGTSDQPIFFNWAFNKTEEQLANSYNNIPEDTQVLITHCPPKGTLDYTISKFNPSGINVGSLELTIALQKLTKLKTHLFGHIHYSNGLIQKNDVVYSNASICNEKYQALQPFNIINV